MTRTLILLAVLFLALAAVGPAVAQEANAPDPEDSVLLRINGAASVPAGETVETAVMINGDIDVAGTVRSTLFVVRGDAVVSGTVGDDLTVIDGNLELQAGATVGDVQLISSSLTQDPAATVTGEINRSSGDFSFGRGLAIFSVLWWAGALIVGLAAAAIFAWLGRDQLYGSIATLKAEFVPSLVTALLLWIVLPIVAGLIIFTLVGAPLGISTLLVLLPILWLLGTVVIGAWIGSYIVAPTSTGRAIGSAMLGAVIIALVSLIPFVGIVVALAGMLGSGALVYRAFERARASDTPPASYPTTV